MKTAHDNRDGIEVHATRQVVLYKGEAERLIAAGLATPEMFPAGKVWHQSARKLAESSWVTRRLPDNRWSVCWFLRDD